MSDRFYASIKIGGPIPKEALPEFIEAVRNEGLLDENYELVEPQKPKDLINHLFGGVLSFHDDQAVYGMFDELETFLQEKNVPYNRFSVSYCEFEAENVYYRPGMEEPLVRHCDTETGECEYVRRDLLTPLLEIDDVSELRGQIHEILGEQVEPLTKFTPEDLLGGDKE